MSEQSSQLRRPNMFLAVLGIGTHAICMIGGVLLISLALMPGTIANDALGLMVGAGALGLLTGALLWRTLVAHVIAAAGAMTLILPAALLGATPLVIAAGVLAVAILASPADEALF